MPTKDYIERHMDVYTDPNITTWQPGMLPDLLKSDIADLAAKPWPKNRLIDTC
jgi:hypothetical protein